MENAKFKTIYCMDCSNRKGNVCTKCGAKCKEIKSCPDHYDWEDYNRGLRKLETALDRNFSRIVGVII